MGGDRELNLLLRGARLELRQTQEQTAAAIGELLGRPVDPEYIGRLERGVVTWPNAEYRAAFQHHFGAASPGELGFYCHRTQRRPVEADDVKRRVFLNALPLPLAMSSGQSLATLVNLGTGTPHSRCRRTPRFAPIGSPRWPGHACRSSRAPRTAGVATINAACPRCVAPRNTSPRPFQATRPPPWSTSSVTPNSPPTAVTRCCPWRCEDSTSRPPSSYYGPPLSPIRPAKCAPAR